MFRKGSFSKLPLRTEIREANFPILHQTKKRQILALFCHHTRTWKALVWKIHAKKLREKRNFLGRKIGRKPDFSKFYHNFLKISFLKFSKNREKSSIFRLPCIPQKSEFFRFLGPKKFQICPCKDQIWKTLKIKTSDPCLNLRNLRFRIIRILTRAPTALAPNLAH